MFLNKLANVIYTKGTVSEDRQITIIHYDSGRILWFGKAKELKFCRCLFQTDCLHQRLLCTKRSH